MPLCVKKATPVNKPVLKHPWAFAPRFRRGGFGWRSEPAITRIKEAITEIKAAARKDAVTGAEGAVLFLEKLSPALEKVDSSSGAIGNAVNRAIDALVPIIAKAPVVPPIRRKWLERLYEAHAEDAIPYIDGLGDHWGEICASPEMASDWADQLVDLVDMIWSRYPQEHGFFHGTSMCLSALYAAGRYEQLLSLLDKHPNPLWSYRQWGVKALFASGKRVEALNYAESARGPYTPAGSIAEACEHILLSSGLADEAYRQYAFEANQAGTYLATFRAICRKYGQKEPGSILEDLVARSPGEEGKWFAAAKDAGLYELALKLAGASPVDHRTLMRAAKDFATAEPGFALNCALLALYWICAGRAYDVTSGEVLDAYELLLGAAEIAHCKEAAFGKLRRIIEGFPQDTLVKGALARKTSLWNVDSAS
jgi:hypothetical protein